MWYYDLRIVLYLGECYNYRLGHLSPAKLASLYTWLAYVLDISCSRTCETCPMEKQKHLLYFVSTSHSNKPFELLHFDIQGPIAITSILGFRYFLTIVGDFSRHTLVYFLKTKFEVTSSVVCFITLDENQFLCRVKIIRFDNGLEFQLIKFFQQKGILHQTSCMETPQQNRVVKCKHQHILNMIRALLFQFGLPKNLWHFVIAHLVFLINSLPSKVFCHKTPFEMLYNKIPNLSFIKIFEC